MWILRANVRIALKIAVCVVALVPLGIGRATHSLLLGLLGALVAGAIFAGCWPLIDEYLPKQPNKKLDENLDNSTRK